MNLEQQVCSLDLAKRLKKLGTKQGGNFWWNGDARLYYRFDKSMVSFSEQVVMKKSAFGDSDEWYTAFTIAELGEILPKWIPERGELIIIRTAAWRFYYGAPPSQSGIKFTASTDGNEADSRAEFLIYLIENKLIAV
jgi:hypothetical protein